MYKANTGVKEIWFRFAHEIVYSIIIKQLVDLSICIYTKTERKEKKRKKEGKIDSISDRLVHIMAKTHTFNYLHKSTELSPILNQFYDLT